MDCSSGSKADVYRPLISTNAVRVASSQDDVKHSSATCASREGGRHAACMPRCQAILSSRRCKVLFGVLVATFLLVATILIPHMLPSRRSPSASSSTPSAISLVNQQKEEWIWDWLFSTATTVNRQVPLPAITLTVGPSFVHVYQGKNRTCTIVHSASNSGTQDCWVMDNSTDDVPECGLWGLYRCYKRKTFEMFTHPHWHRMQTYLASEACSGGVRATGWSLGGTVASVFAACANNAPGNSSFGHINIDGVSVLLPRVHNLVIFGANKITAKRQAENGLAADGVFPGYQFWTERSTSSDLNEFEVDMCQWTPHPDDGFHPKIRRIRVRQLTPSFGFLSRPPFEITLFPPSSNEIASSDKLVLDYGRTGRCGTDIHLSYGFFISAATEAKWA
mmetsp:Transcript_24594/g.44714  ORF Transcript_24594/g.44714 Transcript_24594/m.44714 type:complete len:392 (+) Transcript_24594:78-1253(+)